MFEFVKKISRPLDLNWTFDDWFWLVHNRIFHCLMVTILIYFVIITFLTTASWLLQLRPWLVHNWIYLLLGWGLWLWLRQQRLWLVDTLTISYLYMVIAFAVALLCFAPFTVAVWSFCTSLMYTCTCTLTVCNLTLLYTCSCWLRIRVGEAVHTCMNVHVCIAATYGYMSL